MVLVGPFRERRERFSLKIEPDRLIKYWNERSHYTDSGVISRSDFLRLKEVKLFGRVRGLAVRSKYYLFIPARHPQYSEIKNKLEDWQAHTPRA